MRKYIIGFGITVAVLAVFAVTQLELYRKHQYVSPSKEAAADKYLAMKRWLAAAGHPVRIEFSGKTESIPAAQEKTVFIEASGFDWSDETGEILEPWISAGGALIISVDTYWYQTIDDRLTDFLTCLGIQRSKPDIQNEGTEGPVPDFGWNIAFKTDQAALPKTVTKVQTMSGHDGSIRLVRLSLGNGSVTVTGFPYFMHSDNLKNPENARLSWNLLVPQTGTGSGVLFIQKKQAVKSFWGKLADRGNPIALGVSAAVLLVIGFWMVIPVFGLVLEDPIKPGKPIRERFLAEARFLKKYGALETYCTVYVQEIQRRLRRQKEFLIEGESADIINIIELEKEPKKKLSPRDFVKQIAVLTRTLERFKT